ncbi:hypothetical protein GOV09_02505 [Candidatus Woesearchaeota archaeon]|nr:hypothetical protein [Candidatus Woesearchaeota archaeon]
MKKGIAAGFLAMLILALVVSGIGMLLIKKIDQGTSPFYDKQTCVQSVIWNSKGRLPVANTEGFELDCPTRYVTLFENKYTIESRKTDTEHKIKCGKLDNEKGQECYLNASNKVISGLIFDCWDQFAQGRLQVLDAWDTSRQCVMCAQFTFDTSVQKKFEGIIDNEVRYSKFGPLEYSGLDLTLDNYMRSKKPKYHEISYYELTLDPVDAFQFPYYDYSLKESYAIVFKAINQHQVDALSSSAWDYIKENWLSIETEEGKEFVNVMDVVLYSEVAQICDVLA